MTDCVKNIDESQINTIPEQFKPFSCIELTDRQIEFARKYLNETEETRTKSLRRIKRFLNKELDVFSELDDEILLAFLRTKAFDFKKACLLMKNTAEALKIHQEYFNRIDAEILHRVIASKTVNFLPYRDAKGRIILLVIAENWNPDDLKADDMLFGTVIAMNRVIENPLNQITGCVAIVDCKGISFSHFSELSSWFLACARYLQNSIPFLVNEIHVLHTPLIVQWIWRIMSPLLQENIKKIIHFYDSSNWKMLHEKIPPCILPEELGGQMGPISFEHWANDVPKIRQKFYDKFHRCLNK